MSSGSREALYHCVSGWCGEMDPLLFVYMMKSRNSALSAKVARLKNTVDILKYEADKLSNEIKQLKTRIRFLKKGMT